MSTAFLDSFQLIIAIYLFYVSIKGDGQLYHFGNLNDEQQARVHKPLRILYFIGGCIALAEFGVCSLQSNMFTRETVVSGAVTITQHFTLEAFPFITYELLTMISTILSTLLILLLFGIVFWLIRMGKGNEVSK